MKYISKICHKGFTLIELIVAFAILGVATLAIGGLFVTSARSYSNVNAETTLQKEAQLALNQIENMLIDSTLGVNYNFVTNEADPSGFQFVTNDAQASGEAQSKILYAFNINESLPDHYLALLIKWDTATKTLYYKEVGGAINNSITVANIDITGTKNNGWDLLAEGVEHFSVDLTDYEKTNKVKIVLQMKNQTKEYNTDGIIKLRNSIMINVDSVAQIYSNVSQIVVSEVQNVTIDANPRITTPGGKVQLTAKVTGKGYPSQVIKRWEVATKQNMDNIIYPATGSMDEYITIDAENILTVSKNIVALDSTTYNEAIYVKAYVDDGKGNEIESNVVQIGIKKVDMLSITPSLDISSSYNKNFEPNADEGYTVSGSIYTWPTVSKTSDGAVAIPNMTVKPGNAIHFEGKLEASDSLSDEEATLIWEIHGLNGNTVSSIASSGFETAGKISYCNILVDSNSETGAFLVTARHSLTIEGDDDEDTLVASYQVTVGNKYSFGTNTLAVKIVDDKDQEISTINRGGDADCYVEMTNANGETQKMPVDDFNWYCRLNSSVTGTPVTINSAGELDVDYTLSYDYKYLLTVVAELKSDTSVQISKTVTVPKVYLSISPELLMAKMGDTVTGIFAKAVGLEEYDIAWSMSKETNPTYYFTAFGNTNITGSKASDGRGEAVVKIGKDEPSSITQFRVKAELADNANYYATMKISTELLKLVVSGDTTMYRGESIQLTATSGGMDVTDDEDVKWVVTKVATKQNTIWISSSSSKVNGMSLEEGLLTVTSQFYSSYHYYNQDIYITLQAKWDSSTSGKDSEEFVVMVIPGTRPNDNTGGDNTGGDNTGSGNDSNTNTGNTNPNIARWNYVNRITPAKVLVPNGGEDYVLNLEATLRSGGNRNNISWWNKSASGNSAYINSASLVDGRAKLDPIIKDDECSISNFSFNNYGTDSSNMGWEYYITAITNDSPDSDVATALLRIGFENPIDYFNNNSDWKEITYDVGKGSRGYRLESSFYAVYDDEGSLGDLYYVMLKESTISSPKYYAYIEYKTNRNRTVRDWYQCTTGNGGTISWSSCSQPNGIRFGRQ
ncbi:MAG: type II secretion system protein [Lachnospiraceae bacterium]|nr:type II secretion system protein [Lachnospiraceae bacterium]